MGLQLPQSIDHGRRELRWSDIFDLATKVTDRTGWVNETWPFFPFRTEADELHLTPNFACIERFELAGRTHSPPYQVVNRRLNSPNI